MSTLLEKVKLARRVKHNNANEDYGDNIEACLADLRLHGIRNIDEDDKLIIAAVKFYCFSIYDEDAAKRVEFKTRYDKLRDLLSMSKQYTEVTPDG